MELLSGLFDIVLHIDVHLADWAAQAGPWLYLILFLIVFCETGLVVTPFLPGDSLLFAAGAVAALQGSGMRVDLLILTLVVAAVLGDAVNYSIGYRVGPKVFHRTDSKLLNVRHLERTRAFFEKYGSRTIVLARFVPIVRTFAPFVAGIGKMRYRRFAIYNVTGGIVWVVGFVLAGYFFGNLPVVKDRFHIVILAIIFLSVLPIVYEALRARSEARNGRARPGATA